MVVDLTEANVALEKRIQELATASHPDDAGTRLIAAINDVLSRRARDSRS